MIWMRLEWTECLETLNESERQERALIEWRAAAADVGPSAAGEHAEKMTRRDSWRSE